MAVAGLVYSVFTLFQVASSADLKFSKANSVEEEVQVIMNFYCSIRFCL